MAETMKVMSGMCIGAALLCGAIVVEAFTGYALELGGGTAYSFRTPLEITQSGDSEIEFDADYATKPFKTPFYYVIRAGGFRGAHRWELQMIHHKLYLESNPAEVQQFEVTHGYNIFTINRTFPSDGFEFRAGAGIVVAHTESIVRGQHDHGEDGGLFGWGYRVTGPSVIGGVARPFGISSHFFVTPEIQCSLARAVVPVAGGEASVPNAAVHFVLGIGYRLLTERPGGDER